MIFLGYGFIRIGDGGGRRRGREEKEVGGWAHREEGEGGGLDCTVGPWRICGER